MGKVEIEAVRYGLSGQLAGFINEIDGGTKAGDDVAPLNFGPPPFAIVP